MSMCEYFKEFKCNKNGLSCVVNMSEQEKCKEFKVEKADNGLTAENTMIKYFTQDAELYKDNPDARVSLKLIKDCAKEVEREVKAQYKASLLENYNKIIILDFDCAEHCSAELCPLMPRLAEVKSLIEGDL